MISSPLVPSTPLARRRATIAQMQAPPGERRLELQQPRHGMALSIGIFDPLTQHHVAAAFAVHRNRAIRRRAQAFLKTPGGRQGAGMQFRIAARQPHGVGIGSRRLVRERRKTARSRRPRGANAPADVGYMNEKARSRATAMRWPGGGRPTEDPPDRAAGRAQCCSASISTAVSHGVGKCIQLFIDAVRLRTACTRPRWRSGSDRRASLAMPPNNLRAALSKAA